MDNSKMKKGEYYYMIKGVLDKLTTEGVDAIYQQFRHGNYSNGSSRYSALINDLVGCCPDAKEWKNPRARDCFRQDANYYCNYHMYYYEY